MNSLADLLTTLDISVIFKAIYAIAGELMLYTSSVLFIMAMMIRMTETQLGTLAGNNKYGEMIRDIFLYGTMMALYSGIGVLVVIFCNAIYDWMDSIGSLKEAMRAYTDIMTKNEDSIKAGGITVSGLIAAPFVVIGELLYYGSLVIVSFLSLFLKIANAMTFGVAFIWGLIAIPVSVSKTFNILRGWAWLMALSLVWPIVQGLMMAMFILLFKNAGSDFVSMPDIDPMTRHFDLMMLFSVLNLLLGAVLVAAPFVANALVTNASAASGIIMPFVGAAMTAGLAAVKGRDAQGNLRGGFGGFGGGGSGGGSGNNGNKSSAQSVPAPRVKAAPAPTPAAEGVPVPAAPDVKTSSQAAKQRKGALITQFRKKQNTPGT